jgi:hypothetical protein
VKNSFDKASSQFFGSKFRENDIFAKQNFAGAHFQLFSLFAKIKKCVFVSTLPRAP